MIFYLSIGQLQKQISANYQATHICPNFGTIVTELYHKAEYITEKPEEPNIQKLMQLDDREFLAEIQKLYYAFSTEKLFKKEDYDLISDFYDMTTTSQFYRTEKIIFSSDCFVIYYVFKGKCEFTFLDETRVLEEGDFCIVAPYSKHALQLLTDKSCAFPIFIKEKTFETTFFSLLSDTDILSNFFRKILANPAEPNYLLVETSNSTEIRTLVKLLFLERFRMDSYVNRSDIHWMNLLFINVLRNYSAHSQFSYYNSGLDYTPIFRYIKSHYKTIDLVLLSRKFNYSVSYMSKIIKKVTGNSFVEIIRKLKMEEAATLLINTDDSIEKISEKVSYSSSDHFARTFRKYYGISPMKYRKQHKQFQ